MFVKDFPTEKNAFCRNNLQNRQKREIEMYGVPANKEKKSFVICHS